MGSDRKQGEDFSDLEPFIDGRDELNLAEFPLATLSNRVSEKTETLEFSDRILDKGTRKSIERKLTITASEKYGLPTALDDEVILALVQLSKIQGFRSKTVGYTRYEILKILGWKDNGANYRRVKESLEKWLNVGLKYENAWWNPQEKTWMDESFHLLERLTTPVDEKGNKTHSFVWNEVVFESFRMGNLKSIDLGIYRRLKSPTAKRLFRLLDKKFYLQKHWEFDLHTLAFQKLGMSRNYQTGNLKQKLLPAIQELEEIGFITPMEKKQRFKKLSCKLWKVVFDRAEDTECPNQLKVLSPTTARTNQLEARLTDLGVSKGKAKRLMARHPSEYLQHKIEILEYLLQGDAKPDNPAGFLVKSIEEDYAAPPGFQSQEEFVREDRIERETQQRLRTLAEEREKRRREGLAREEAIALEKQRVVGDYLSSLAGEDTQKLMNEALKTGNPNMLKLEGIAGKIYREQLLQNYVLGLIANTSRKSPPSA
jgi:Replication initiator protein A